MNFSRLNPSIIKGMACIIGAFLIAATVGFYSPNNANGDTQLYGSCGCGIASICSGSNGSCGGAVCITPGDNCNLITKNYPTSTCVSGQDDGHCGNASTYTCWQQLQCTCTDITWPWSNRCNTEGGVINSGTATKSLCQQ